jgi:carbon-monoxide dehydrogenase medium subunit
VTLDDGHVRIGAMARQRDIEDDTRMPGLLRAAIPHIANFQVRNRGTVGGSLAHMDPAAEWPAVALVMDAVLVAASVRGRREIAAHDFTLGPYTTALEPDELLVEVVMPKRADRFAFAEVTRRGTGDFALAGAACYGTAVAVFGVGSRPQRLRTVEAALERGALTVADVAALAVAEIQAEDDVHSSAAYRRRVAAALVGKVVAEAEGNPAWS